MKKSYFDGSILGMIGWNFLSSLLTVITFGIGYPWSLCMLKRWETKHTVICSQRLKFNGKGLQLLGLWILLALVPYVGLLIVLMLMRGMVQSLRSNPELLILLLLCVLVAALCYWYFVRIQIIKWEVKHTEFEIYLANWATAPQTNSAESAPAASAPASAVRGPEITADGPMEVVLSLGTLFVGIPAAIAGLGFMLVGRFLEGGILFCLGIVLLLVSYFKQ